MGIAKDCAWMKDATTTLQPSLDRDCSKRVFAGEHTVVTKTRAKTASSPRRQKTFALNSFMFNSSMPL
jgi:hypothetical protein